MSTNNIGGEGVWSAPPRSVGAAYTDPQNTSYGFFNAAGQHMLGSRTLPPYQVGPNIDPSNVSISYTSPATIQTFPIRPGGDSSQITANNQAKAIFNSMNLQSNQVSAGLRRPQYPLFSSQQDLIRYIQGQYTQAIPGTTTAKTYSVNTLFRGYGSNT